MKKFSQFIEEQNHDIDESFLGGVKKWMFGIKTPQERIEIARNSVRKFLWNLTASGLWNRFRKHIRPKHMMDHASAWEYLYVWGNPVEKKNAEFFLKTKARMAFTGKPYDTSRLPKLKSEWSHDSKWAFITFGGTKCCMRFGEGKSGPIDADEFEALKVIR